MKKKQHKMDPHLISNQSWEIDYVIEKMKKEGISITHGDVRDAKKDVGNSRKKIYNYLRGN